MPRGMERTCDQAANSHRVEGESRLGTPLRFSLPARDSRRAQLSGQQALCYPPCAESAHESAELKTNR
jgi:hypothetical protein